MSIASALSLPSVGIRLSGVTNRFIEAHTKLGLWSLRSSYAELPRKHSLRATSRSRVNSALPSAEFSISAYIILIAIVGFVGHLHFGGSLVRRQPAQFDAGRSAGAAPTRALASLRREYPSRLSCR